MGCGVCVQPGLEKQELSTAVAEMGDRCHNRHGPKGEGVVPLPRSAGNPSNTVWPVPYQVAPSSIQPFDHNSVGCHSPRRNISTNYYFVVEMQYAQMMRGIF